MNSVSVTIPSRQAERLPVVIGDKVRAGKATAKDIKRHPKLRGKLMVRRLLKKDFTPIFIVTASWREEHAWRFNMKPYNF